MNLRSPLFLAGPTASGKSAVALALARRLEGEIISVDSMQVYRGLDVGTAKPTLAERAQVRHHLVDAVDVGDTFDAARFEKLATNLADDIARRGKTPIFCGGTGLYFKALLSGVGDAPGAAPAIRQALESLPLETLLAELAEKDPPHYAAIDQKNKRRVVRALEIIRVTGKPCSSQRAAWKDSDSTKAPSESENGQPILHLLVRSREDLRDRIHRRVEAMFAQGLVKETAALLARGLAENRSASLAIGYRQVIEHLRGDHTLEQTVALVQQKTWQYARRQMTWFRHQARTQSVDVPPDELPDVTASRIIDLRWRSDGGSD